MAGWRVRGLRRVPLGRPGPALLGFGGLAGVPSVAVSYVTDADNNRVLKLPAG